MDRGGEETSTKESNGMGWDEAFHFQHSPSSKRFFSGKQHTGTHLIVLTIIFHNFKGTVSRKLTPMLRNIN